MRLISLTFQPLTDEWLWNFMGAVIKRLFIERNK